MSKELDREPLEARELADIYHKYGHLVLRICREILRQEHDAQDAMHETFLKFWRYAPKLRNREEFVGGLRRTAVSCAIDLLRSRKRQGCYQEAWAELREVVLSEREQHDTQRLFQRDVISLLFRAVKVDESTLQMAYFYYMDEMTLEEVAEATGFSRRSVGMKLERFRAQALKYCRNHDISLS